jgi:hypothetical protein
MGRNSSVSIATGYELDGPGIESRWGEIFAIVQSGPGAHPASYTIGTGYCPGLKRTGRAVDHPPPSSAEVKERVELYLYSSSQPVLGQTLSFILWTRLLCLQPSICSPWPINHNYADKLQNLIGLNEKEEHNGSFVHRNQQHFRYLFSSVQQSDTLDYGWWPMARGIH